MFSRGGHHLVLHENLGERFLCLVKRRRRGQCNMLCMLLPLPVPLDDNILGSHANAYFFLHPYHLNMPHRKQPHLTNFSQLPQNNTRPSRQLGPPRLPLAHDLWPRLLRRRNDAPLHPALRPRQTRNNFSRIPPSIGRNDCSGDAHQQNGSCITPSV